MKSSKRDARAEIRRERGAYAVYVRGRHYASCDSLHEAQEEIEGMESAPERGGTPGAQQFNQLQYTGTQEKLQQIQGGKNGKAL